MHEVALVVHDRFQSLDLTGPVEVFHTATLLLPTGRGYRTRVLGLQDTAESSSGLRLAADARLGDDDGPIDTLVIVGGLGIHDAVDAPGFVDQIDRLADRSSRVTSVCTGAFALAATGRLDNRRAVTHWASCDDLARDHPQVEVVGDAIFVRDGQVWTSAGVTAGMDLALALVADDHGAELAHTVAGWLVMFARRGGGQSQFSPQLLPTATAPELRTLVGWIADHLGDDLSVSRLAERCGVSPRHFARLFRDEMGTTPAAYVESVRIDTARRLLETTDLTVAEIARQVGFGSDAVLHRAFSRTVRTTPGSYRTHFARHPRR